MSDLDYAPVVGRFGINIGDGADADETPDTIWCTTGLVRIKPLQSPTRVVGADPMPWTGGNASIDATFDEHGHLTWNDRPVVWVVDLTSEKVNPSIGEGLATHSVQFIGVKASGINVEFPAVNVRLAADTMTPGVHPETEEPMMLCDLTKLMPVAVGPGTAIVVGPRGVGIDDVTVVGDSLEVELEDGSVKTTALPATLVDSDTFVGNRINTPGTASNEAVIAQIPTLNPRSKGAVGDGVTDDTVAIQQSVAAAAAFGFGVGFPAGRFAISETIIVPSGVALRGSGSGAELYSDQDGAGTVIVPADGADLDVMVAMEGWGARVEGINIDGLDIVPTGVTIEGFQNRLIACEVRRNSAYNVHVKPHLNGHENNIIDCFFTQNAVGVNVFYEGTSSIPCNDNLISNSVMRGGEIQVKTLWSGANQFVGCHFYAYPSATATHNVLAVDSSWQQFVGCYFDAPRNGIPLEVRSNDAPVYQPLVSGCSFLNFSSSMPDNTNPAIKLDGTIFSIRGSNISGNIFAGYGPTRRFSFAVKALGFGRNGHIFANNSLYNCGSVFDPYPAQQSGNTLDGLAVATSMRLTDPAYEAMSTDVIDDLYRRWRLRANGTHEWGSGAAPSDVTLGRSAANVLSLGADDALKTGAFTTTNRPSAATLGAGATLWDSTAQRPLYSDGATWRLGSVEGVGTRAGEYLPANALTQTFSRAGAKVEGASLPGGSGRQHFVRARLRAGQVVNSITFVALGTGAASPTHQWFSLYDAQLNRLAVTVNDTTTAWAAGATKTLALSAPYTVPADGDFYFGVMVAATTVPNLACVVGSSAVAGIAPIVGGYDATNSGLTTPASAPAVAAGLTASGVMPYAYAS